MPGQMTLDDVVRAGQEGVQWGQQQEQVRRQQQAQKIQDEADKAATAVIEQSKAEWAMNGAQGQYRPNDTTMLKAAEARGMHFAKSGDWRNFVQNEAMVAPQRIRVRSSALQQYQTDGDVDKLARTVYPTFFDGNEIVGSEIVKGGEGGLKGAPSGPDVYRFKLSDGSTRTVEPAKLVADIKSSLIDPQKAAEQEVQLNLLRAQETIKAGAKVTVEKAKGAEDRATEGVKQTNRLTLANVQGERARDVAKIGAGATLGAARIGADSRIAVAEAKADGKGAGDKDGLAVTEKWLNLSTKVFGKVSGGLMGSSRMAGQATLDLAVTAQRIHEANKGVLTEAQALDQAARFLKLQSPDSGLDAILDGKK